MKSRKALLMSITLLMLIVFTIPAASQPTDSIIVNNANTVRQDSFILDQDLGTLFTSVDPRIVVQYANHLREISLVNFPSTLGTLISQVSDRIIMLYANNNRQETLTYPIDFFNDSMAPIITNITAQGMGIITWETNEFATSTAIYDVAIVVDMVEITDPLFTKQHRVVLTGLTPGEEYNYRVRSTDRSGNTSTSSEHSFTAQETLTIFLPFIVGTR